MSYFVDEKLGSNGKYITIDDDKFQIFSKLYFELIESGDYSSADYMRENIFRDAHETFLNVDNVKVLREIQGPQLHHPIVKYVFDKCKYYENLTLAQATIRDKEEWEIYKKLIEYSITGYGFMNWRIINCCIHYEFRTFKERDEMEICAHLFNMFNIKDLVTPHIYECARMRTKGKVK